MDGRGFDDLTRRFATRRPRRAVLKGLLGLGGAVVAATVGQGRTDAAWSTLVCLPDGGDGYIQRLVPTAAVPFYVARYGAVLPENGFCPGICVNCTPEQNACLINDSCAQSCTSHASCPAGCACSLSSTEGTPHCATSGISSCEQIPQACASTSECAPGWQCQESTCGSDRCVPLCGTPL